MIKSEEIVLWDIVRTNIIKICRKKKWRMKTHRCRDDDAIDINFGIDCLPGHKYGYHSINARIDDSNIVINDNLSNLSPNFHIDLCDPNIDINITNAVLKIIFNGHRI